MDDKYYRDNRETDNRDSNTIEANHAEDVLRKKPDIGLEQHHPQKLGSSMDRQYLSGIAMGVMVTLSAIMLVIIVTSLTGLLSWKGLFYGNSGSVLTSSLTQKIQEIQAMIDRYYLDDVDEETMEDAVCSGILAGLGDDYAAYYNEDDYQDMQEKTYGNYCGIGAYVSQNATSGAITITQPIKGGPAEKAGLMSGDVISEIDGKSIEGQDLSAVVSRMKGEEGTKVKVGVLRDGASDPITFTVTRKEIQSQTVSYKMLDDETGYICITSFEDVTKEQFRKAIKALEKKGEKGLVIDLRDNGGGLLDTAVDMLDRLLPKGVVVYTLDNKGKKKEYSATDKESFDKPIAVLVNGNSASASEVFSGALQDYGKAVLVGTTTFGKGIVQSVFDLSDGTALKFTTAKYYTPKGRNIHGTGLTPDMEVEYDDALSIRLESGATIDNQVQTAVDYLENK